MTQSVDDITNAATMTALNHLSSWPVSANGLPKLQRRRGTGEGNIGSGEYQWIWNSALRFVYSINALLGHLEGKAAAEAATATTDKNNKILYASQANLFPVSLSPPTQQHWLKDITPRDGHAFVLLLPPGIVFGSSWSSACDCRERPGPVIAEWHKINGGDDTRCVNLIHLPCPDMTCEWDGPPPPYKTGRQENRDVSR